MEAILKKLINSYPEIKREEPSSWFVFNNSLSKQAGELNAVCHADMAYHTAGQYDQCVTAIACDTPLDLAYIKFLIDGPFRSFRDRISLDTFKVEDADPKYYLHMTKLDTWPANVLYNLCIATRVPTEYPWFLKHWGRLVAAGVHDALAFLVVSRVAYSGTYWDVRERGVPNVDPWDLVLDRIECPTGHFWFDTTSDWRTVLFGEPVVKSFSPNYKANPKQVRPCNVIWGKSNRDEAQLLVGKTVKELTDYFELTKPRVSTIEKMMEEYDPNGPLIIDLADDDDDDDNFEDDEVFDDDDLDF